MKQSLCNLYRDERGAVVVMVGALLALLLVFSVYAIDASQMLLVKTQLQNAADAGALAGAVVGALTGDTTDAQNGAILAAGANNALRDSAGARNRMDPVVITDADVVFPQARRIVVTTHRTEATGDQFLNYFMRIFTADNSGVGEMTARAAAEFTWVCAGRCLKPWAPVDRWDDADNDDRYDAGEYYDPYVTGYNNTDIGAEIILARGGHNQETFGPEWYYLINFPPVNKGNPISGAGGNPGQFPSWIIGCPDGDLVVEPGDTIQIEPGQNTGPHRSATEEFIALDPLAEWDNATGTVINSAYSISPRIIKAPFFDPSIGVTNLGLGRKALVVAKIGVFFLVGMDNNQRVTGRFMRLAEPEEVACTKRKMNFEIRRGLSAWWIASTWPSAARKAMSIGNFIPNVCTASHGTRYMAWSLGISDRPMSPFRLACDVPAHSTHRATTTLPLVRLMA